MGLSAPHTILGLPAPHTVMVPSCKTLIKRKREMKGDLNARV
jgi:hypothetical protein